MRPEWDTLVTLCEEHSGTLSQHTSFDPTDLTVIEEDMLESGFLVTA